MIKRIWKRYLEWKLARARVQEQLAKEAGDDYDELAWSHRAAQIEKRLREAGL